MAKLTENEYTTIKQLLGKGYEGLKVAEIVGRGRGLISAVNNTASYKEFVERGKATRAKYKASAKLPQQLPLDTPKKTKYDLLDGMVDKVVALRDDIKLYMDTPACSTHEQQRGAKMALVKLDEASMWLTRLW